MRNISMIPLFSIGRTATLAQATGQQGFCSNDFKTETSPLAGEQFHQSIETFRVACGISMGEVVENSVSPAFGSQHQGEIGIKDLWRDPVLPRKVAVPCFIERGSFIHTEKCFFLCIGQCQAGEVSQPRFNDQAVLLVQIYAPLEQQVAVMHQGPALFVCQACSYLFTDGFKATMKQFDDMEPVYHEPGMRQYLVNSVMVAGPHVSANHLNLRSNGLGQALQIPDHGFFTAISEQVNNLMVFDISKHTTVLIQQIQLVDPQAGDWCARPIRF